MCSYGGFMILKYMLTNHVVGLLQLRGRWAYIATHTHSFIHTCHQKCGLWINIAYPNFEVHFAQYEKYTYTRARTHTLKGGKTWFWQKRLPVLSSTCSSPIFDDCVWRVEEYTRKTRIVFKDFNVKIKLKKKWCSRILIYILFDEPWLFPISLPNWSRFRHWSAGSRLYIGDGKIARYIRLLGCTTEY